MIRQLIYAHPTAHVWLGGDFNLQGVSWDTMCALPPGVRDPALYNAAVQLVLDTALTHVVTEPTR